MIRAKKKRNSGDKFIVSEKQLNKIKEELSAEAVTKTGMLYLAAMAERGWDEDQIVELFETIQRYAQYIDDHLIRIRDVQQTIETRTGIKMRGRW